MNGKKMKMVVLCAVKKLLMSGKPIRQTRIPKEALRIQSNAPTLLLRDRAARKKLCRKLNKDTQCKTQRGCENCPITIFARVEMLVNSKRLSIGEAYLISRKQEGQDGSNYP